MERNMEKPIPLEKVLDKFNKHNKEFIKTLDREEIIENVENVDVIENEIKRIKLTTERYKDNFINDLKSDLGEEVKTNPNEIKKIKKSFWEKLKNNLKTIFTRF